MRKQWRFWLGLVVSLVFVLLVVRQVSDLSRSLTAAQQANYWYLVPALSVYFIGVWVRAIRWGFLLGPVKSIAARRLFPVVVIGYMANDILPMRIGELVRAYVLGERENVSKSATFATIIVERIFDGVTMVLFIGVVLLLHLVPANPELEHIFRLTGGVFVGVLLLFFAVALSPGTVNRLLDVMLSGLTPALAERVAPSLRRFLTGLSVLQSPRAVAATLGLSIVAWLCEAGMYYLLAFGFTGIDLPYYAMVLTTAVANLGTLIPSAPSYIGTFEWFSVFVLRLYRIDNALALSYTVVLHIALVVPITLWGLYYWWRFHLSLSAIQTPSAAPQGSEP